MSSSVFETDAPGDYLERLAASDVGRSYKAPALDLLDLQSGQAVVDLGCGPGADLPSLLAGVGAAGRVIGVDSDPQMLDRAAVALGAGSPVELLHADIHHLPLADASMDRARTDRVLQHVADPAAVLGDVRRVLRTGGRLVICEPDWDTLGIDVGGELAETGRAYRRFIVERVIRQPILGRQLARIASSTGYDVPVVHAHSPVVRDAVTADRIFGFRRTTERAVAAGYLQPEAGQRWLAGLAGANFLASMTLYVVVAVRS